MKLNLQGRGSNQTGKLVFGGNLFGHEIEQANGKGSNVLSRRENFIHDHDPFTGQDFVSGEIGREFNGHGGKIAMVMADSDLTALSWLRCNNGW